LGGVELLPPRRSRLEGIQRQRFEAEAAEQVVHGCVADDDHAFERARVSGAFRQEVGRQGADLLARQVLQHALVRTVQGEFNAAHDVGAVLGLRVERRAHAQHASGLPVHQLRHEGGGAQVHRETPARLRREIQR